MNSLPARLLGEALLVLVELLLEGGRLLQLEPHVQADDAERTGDQERQPPAPVEHLGVGQRQVEDGDQRRAQGVADEGAEVEPAGEEAPPPVG
ncbi:hypothetical protein RKD40_007006 [Streptomyces ambofaciens]